MLQTRHTFKIKDDKRVMDKYDFGLVLAKSADSSAHKSLNPSELTPYMQYIDMIQKTKWKPSRPENV